jgi:hypothetical protein
MNCHPLPRELTFHTAADTHRALQRACRIFGVAAALRDGVDDRRVA